MQARLHAELTALTDKPLDWLKAGPGKDSADNPGWTNPGKPRTAPRRVRIKDKSGRRCWRYSDAVRSSRGLSRRPRRPGRVARRTTPDAPGQIIAENGTRWHELTYQ